MDIFKMLQSGETAKAIDLLVKHLQMKPDDIPALALYARVMASVGRTDVSVAALNKILTLDAKEGRAWFGLAELARAREDFAEAERCYRKAIELSPEDAVAAYHLGLVCSHLAREADARDAYNTGLARDPKLVEAWVNLGNLDYAEGNHAAARNCYAQALSIDPQRAEAVEAMAILDARESAPSKDAEESAK